MARTAHDMRQRSKNVTEGPERAPHRAMLRATGLRDDDLKKPLVGVASSWNEVTPCNLHLDVDAKDVKAGVRTAGGTPIQFTTIAVSDGIAMGHEGMKASLVSREVIADSVELMMLAHGYDAIVGLAGVRQVAAGHADGDGPHELTIAGTRLSIQQQRFASSSAAQYAE